MALPNNVSVRFTITQNRPTRRLSALPEIHKTILWISGITEKKKKDTSEYKGQQL